MNQVPEKLINYSVYRNGSEYLGTADVELPSLEALTETISGAGIAGEIDSPTIGHFGSMTTTLNWRTIDVPLLRLAAPISHALDFRGAQQVYDKVTGTQKSVGVRVSVRTLPKSTGLGTLAPNATTGSSNGHEVTYLKVMIDGKTLLELDKYNYIYIVDGVDYMAVIRNQLGM